MEGLAHMLAIGYIFLLVLGILWFFLPFAVFGTKPKIDKLLEEAKRANELLAEIKDRLSKQDPR
jgi:hypothetical protein